MADLVERARVSQSDRDDHPDTATGLTAGPRRLPAWQRRDAIALALLICLGTGLPLALSAGSGALGVPQNDDWAFRRIAGEFFRSHHIVLIGWGQMTLVGQVLSVQPLLALSNGSGWAYGVYGAMSGGAALAATYCAARRFVPTGRALLAGLLVALAPGFLATEPTFMTDVPALAATMACLAVGLYALDRTGRSHWVWLSVAMAVGVFGFSVRQMCLAAPLAVLLVALWRRPDQWRWLFVIGAVTGAACLGTDLWFSHLPGPHEPNTFAITWTTELETLKLGADLAMAVLPAVIWVLMRAEQRIVRALPPLLAVAVVALTLAGFNPGSVLAGNLVSQQGVTGSQVLAGTRPTLFSGTVWSAIQWSALASVVSVAALVLTQRRATRSVRGVVSWFARPEGVLGAFLVIAGGGLLVFTAAGAFDRYCWPLVGPFAILVVMAARSRPAHSLRLAMIGLISLSAVLGAGELILAANSDAFDAARWQAGQSLTRLGIPARAVDAGYEWLGYHQSGPISPGSPPGATQYVWYEWIFDAPVCGVVSSSPLSDTSLKSAGLAKYRLLEVAGPEENLYRYTVPHMMRACTK
ncbi:MAG: glycosyltransferase family 39 protein [Acidimicrobiales bacterium]|jgi:4-amino-4-deoxy-L-arabinose transferase-like glycosyltransferase